MIEYFLKACEVCEQGALTAEMRQVAFRAGRLQATNGIIQYQAPSGLDKSEEFAVSEAKLVSALRSCSDNLKAETTAEFLRLKDGPLTVRVRKVKEEVRTGFPVITIPKSAESQKATPLKLLETLRLLAPFVSSDYSRSWSPSVLFRDGYLWATNNVALVRSPMKIPKMLEGARFPAPAVRFLCDLKSLGHFHIDEKGSVIFTSDRAIIRFPQLQHEWPDMAPFFAKMPKKMPPVPDDLRNAAERVKKFAERFVSLSKDKVESKHETLESEYEVDIAKGKGTYNSALLTLILSSCSHIDFSFYPDPIFFRGEGIEGTAVGMKQ